MFKLRLSLITLLVLSITTLHISASTYVQDKPADNIVRIEIPLKDGKLSVRDILNSMCDAAGIDPGERFDKIKLSINVSSTLGKLQLRILNKATGGTMNMDVQDDRVVLEIDRNAVAKQTDLIYGQLQKWISPPEKANNNHPRYGLTVVTKDNDRAPMSTLPQDTTHAVVLVHGLDDPGWMWRDLTPYLLDADYVVLRFEYPNDQPISESADLLASHLATLPARGIKQIDIVAHSMGGLVARDTLTRKAYYNSDGIGSERYPTVDRLIMLGTPNHGSKMVWLRGVAEVREQLYRWIKGNSTLKGALTDGRGEAGHDLHPDSDFLRRLNARSNPSHTTYTIIAGRLSPIDEQGLDKLIEHIKKISESDNSTDWLRKWVRDAETNKAMSMLAAAVRGLGDGIVTLKSAKLEGVEDIVEVEANHISMIANVFSSKTPPAIGIIIDRLGSDATKPDDSSIER